MFFNIKNSRELKMLTKDVRSIFDKINTPTDINFHQWNVFLVFLSHSKCFEQLDRRFNPRNRISEKVK